MLLDSISAAQRAAPTVVIYISEERYGEQKPVHTSVCETEEDRGNGNKLEKGGDSTESELESVWQTSRQRQRKSNLAARKLAAHFRKEVELTQRMVPCYPSTIDPYETHSSFSIGSTTKC